MDSIRNCSVPPELGQGWYRENWFNNADLALRSGGSPHSPHEVRPPMGGFPGPGVGPVGNAAAVAAAKHAAGDYKVNADEEFKKQVVAVLMQREAEMRIVVHQVEQLHIKLEAVSLELVKTKAAHNDEIRMREEMMSVMVAKEKMEKEERARRETGEAKKKEELAANQREELKRLHETIARLEEGQQALREHVEKRYDEEEQRRRAEENRMAELLTKEILEKEMKTEAEKMREDESYRDEKMVNAQTPSSGMPTPANRVKTPSSKGSGGVTCFSCHGEGHYARDCVDVDVECELCGGLGHAASSCIPSKRCYNCNKTGHRHYECKEQGTRRCFHCRKVGHLAINCKNAPKQ